MPIQAADQTIPCRSSHIFPKPFCPCPYISPLPPPHFYRLTPNHLHSYAPDAYTVSILTTSATIGEYPKDCTNPHFAFYPSMTLLTSISPSYTLLSPNYADFQPSLFMCRFHMSIHSGYEPEYLADLIHYHRPQRQLRSADHKLLQCLTPRTIFASRAFCFAAPRIWSSLPHDMTDNQLTLAAFKRSFESFLFNRHFAG